MFDTHCHVHFRAFQQDMDAVIRRTLKRGIRMITVGTQTMTSRTAVETAQKYDGLWATVGLHPDHTCAQEFFDEQEGAFTEDPIKTRCETFDADFYRTLACKPKVVAIGECGLDYFRLPEKEDRATLIARQREIFCQQVALADELQLPVVIHCRDAHADAARILGAYVQEKKLARRGVVHCFTGTFKEAEAYHALGFLTSFTGIVTFPPKKGEGSLSAVQRVAQALPLEMILLETDAPYLTPEPYRGTRNEPWMVTEVAKKIAELKGISFEEVSETTSRSAERLFGFTA